MGDVTVKSILKEYLSQNGFEGIVNIFCECSCELDDLFPCGEDFSDCSPGYKTECTCGEGCLFHISTSPE